MNQQMWANPATQANCGILTARGIVMAGPASGSQACGETGPGRMLEPAELLRELGLHASGCLQGRTVVVTAGPTYEDIDPVRFIGNRSSGKMGFAMAAAAADAGASVNLVAGPVMLETPAGVKRFNVRGAVEMRDVAVELASGADIFISVAAVADYTPADPARQKIKKGPQIRQLDLVRTPDIVAEVAALDSRPFTIGFAAETENMKQHAFEKLSRKRLDMIAANRVGQQGSGFESEENEILLLTPDDEIDLGKGSKRHLAQLLLEEAAKRLGEKEDVESCSDQDT
jgi:phosphopantothenoylcysteine decarboxylase/phosphopantothenate--cysteine ligase